MWGFLYFLNIFLKIFYYNTINKSEATLDISIFIFYKYMQLIQLTNRCAFYMWFYKPLRFKVLKCATPLTLLECWAFRMTGRSQHVCIWNFLFIYFRRRDSIIWLTNEVKSLRKLSCPYTLSAFICFVGFLFVCLFHLFLFYYITHGVELEISLSLFLKKKKSLQITLPKVCLMCIYLYFFFFVKLTEDYILNISHFVKMFCIRNLKWQDCNIFYFIFFSLDFGIEQWTFPVSV